MSMQVPLYALHGIVVVMVVWSLDRVTTVVTRDGQSRFCMHLPPMYSVQVSIVVKVEVKVVDGLTMVSIVVTVLVTTEIVSFFSAGFVEGTLDEVAVASARACGACGGFWVAKKRVSVLQLAMPSTARQAVLTLVTVDSYMSIEIDDASHP